MKKYVLRLDAEVRVLPKQEPRLNTDARWRSSIRVPSEGCRASPIRKVMPKSSPGWRKLLRSPSALPLDAAWRSSIRRTPKSTWKSLRKFDLNQ